MFPEEAESYRAHKHLVNFKKEDMPEGQASVQPVLVPFSRTLPDLEKVYCIVTSTFRSGDVHFPDDVKVTMKAAYPLLIPYYLVEMVDKNPYYWNASVCA